MVSSNINGDRSAQLSEDESPPAPSQKAGSNPVAVVCRPHEGSSQRPPKRPSEPLPVTLDFWLPRPLYEVGLSGLSCGVV